MLGSINSNAPGSLYPQKSAPIAAQDKTVEFRVDRTLNSLPADADASVTYHYDIAPDGRQVAVSARIKFTESTEKKSLIQRVDATQDNVTLSDAAKALTQEPAPQSNESGLTYAEKAYIQRLQQADSAVRIHEGLHFRAASGLGDLPNYQTVTGPDGKHYAVGGHVTVATTSSSDEAQTTRQLQTLGIAANAPGDASAADLGAARKFGFKNARVGNSEPRPPIETPKDTVGSVDILV